MDYFLCFRYGDCIFKVERSGDASRTFSSYHCWKVLKKFLIFFFVVPILISVFSLTSIFSELGNGACFALVPHFPHNVVRLILLVELDILTAICDFYHSVSSGAFGKFGGIVGSHFRLQTDVGKACWIIGTVCMAVNAPLIVFSVPASWPPRVVILSKKSRSDMECKRFCLIKNGDAHPTARRTFERW